jgi:hypothetical protein
MPTPTVRNVLLNSKTKTSTLMTFDTTKAGSAATHLVLPFIATGTYACTIKWGDGTSNYITAWNDASLDHTYAASGTYDVEIIGICYGWRYADAGDKLKLMKIKKKKCWQIIIVQRTSFQKNGLTL